MAKTTTLSGLPSGMTYTAATDQTWATVSPANGTSTGANITLSISAAAYTGTSANRTATLTVTAADGATATVAITQNKLSVLTLTPASLTYLANGN
jgi:hypothetical protein